MPWSAMMKFSTRYGIMLLCGWLPPTLVTLWGLLVPGVHRRQERAGRVGAGAGRVAGRLQPVEVGGKLLDVDGHAGAAGGFTQRVGVAHVDRNAAAQVGKREVGLPVASVAGAQEREQRLVLVDGQELPIAQRPAFGWKVERDDLDLAQEWL
jgi:hypothetical protein